MGSGDRQALGDKGFSPSDDSDWGGPGGEAGSRAGTKAGTSGQGTSSVLGGKDNLGESNTPAPAMADTDEDPLGLESKVADKVTDALGTASGLKQTMAGLALSQEVSDSLSDDDKLGGKSGLLGGSASLAAPVDSPDDPLGLDAKLESRLQQSFDSLVDKAKEEAANPASAPSKTQESSPYDMASNVLNGVWNGVTGGVVAGVQALGEAYRTFTDDPDMQEGLDTFLDYTGKVAGLTVLGIGGMATGGWGLTGTFGTGMGMLEGGVLAYGSEALSAVSPEVYAGVESAVNAAKTAVYANPGKVATATGLLKGIVDVNPPETLAEAAGWAVGNYDTIYDRVIGSVFGGGEE